MIFHGMLNFYDKGRAHTQHEKPICYGIPDVQNELLILYEKNIYKMKFYFVRLLVQSVIRFTEPHTK